LTSQRSGPVHDSTALLHCLAGVIPAPCDWRSSVSRLPHVRLYRVLVGEVASIRAVRTLGAPAVDWADRADAALAGTGATKAGALRFLSPVVLFSYVICSDRRCFRGCSASVRPYASAVDAVTQRKSVTHLRKSENAGSHFGGLHRSFPDFEMALFSQIRRTSLVGHAEFVSDWTVDSPRAGTNGSVGRLSEQPARGSRAPVPSRSSVNPTTRRRTPARWPGNHANDDFHVLR